MFGQQFTNPIASAAKWIFFGFSVVILMGFLLGADIKDAKWLNSEIAAAEANRINIENTHQQATYELQERLATAQTEAEIQQILREQQLLDAQYQHDIQVLAQDLAHREITFRARMAVLTFTVGLFAITLSIISFIWFGSRAIVYIRSVSLEERSMTKFVPSMEKKIPTVSEREPYDPWNSPAYRRSKRVAAQEQEREENAARMINYKDPGHMTPEEYKKSPEAK